MAVTSVGRSLFVPPPMGAPRGVPQVPSVVVPEEAPAGTLCSRAHLEPADASWPSQGMRGEGTGLLLWGKLCQPNLFLCIALIQWLHCQSRTSGK